MRGALILIVLIQYRVFKKVACFFCVVEREGTAVCTGLIKVYLKTYLVIPLCSQCKQTWADSVWLTASKTEEVQVCLHAVQCDAAYWPSSVCLVFGCLFNKLMCS